MSELVLKFKQINWLLVFLVTFLSFVGLVMIYSATFDIGDHKIFFFTFIQSFFRYFSDDANQFS